MPLSLSSVRARVEDFLSANGLRLDRVDCYVAVTRHEDSEEILAGGGLQGNVIKCVAVSEEARSEGLTNKLISYLISLAHEKGYDSVKLFTKPSNLSIFKSLGFELLAESQDAILMENGRVGLRDYKKYLSTLKREGKNGAIVMNANPFTKGHRYLIEQAAAKVDNLYVIVVKEDLSRFPYVERKAMIEKACKDLSNVIVCEGSDYVISSATFPTYFLKSLDTASQTQMSLDINLFSKHIAPLLDIKCRFAGSEPTDDLTRSYNQMMLSLLPDYGVEFVEIPRAEYAEYPISASKLRKFLDDSLFAEAVKLAHPVTIPYLLSDLACLALKMELDTTPKPGLVDKKDNGAHADMGYDTMLRSIESLRPYFSQIAVDACEGLDVDKIRRAGLDAEHSMLKATAGVNTHKGALFCIGLSVAVASFLACRDGVVTEQAFRENLAALAGKMTAAADTHGATVIKKYRVSGALENAQRAYPELFEDWLPYFNSLSKDEYRCHKTLLKIMSTLDDTNVLHRNGNEGLAQVKKEAMELLSDFSIAKMADLNEKYIRRNTSPGGSADMLSLTVFISHIILTTNSF